MRNIGGALKGRWWVGPFGPSQVKWLAAAEIVFVFAGTLLYIWRWQFLLPDFPLYLFGFWLASFFLHGDTPKTLGLQARGLAGALGEALLVSAGMGLVLVGVGAANGRLAMLHFSGENFWMFTRYFGWCLCQQFGMQAFFTNRLLVIFERPHLAALVSGVNFAAFHLPDPVLVPPTLVGGYLLAWLFSRRRHLLPLALGQAIIATLVGVVFPASWHHGLRVGPVYYQLSAPL